MKLRKEDDILALSYDLSSSNTFGTVGKSKYDVIEFLSS